MKRIIIGEGSYGCVHKPSIRCKKSPKQGFSYEDYVSKIMKTENAVQELKEFVTIKKIDPDNKFHLGSPILCEPDLQEEDIKKEISDCKYIKGDEVFKNPDNYKLLLMKYGGVDLKALATKYLSALLAKDKQLRVDTFWINVHHLFSGLKFFKKHGLVHNDLKPQNIVFNPDGFKLSYIDFGMMRTQREMIISSKGNDNYLSLFHWSYPFECGFMNINSYYYLKSIISANKTDTLTEKLAQAIVNNDKKYINNLSEIKMHNPGAYSILFTYINPEGVVPSKDAQYAYVRSFMNGFKELVSEFGYQAVLERIIGSIDIYGLGFSLQYMANAFKRENAMSLEDFTRLSAFFNKMYNFNILERSIDLDSLMNEYETILLEIGVLTRLNRSFENNRLVNKAPIPAKVMKESIKEEKSPERLSASLQKIAEEDPIIITVKCPEGSELNPLTKRCVKRCREGYIRNDAFKCVQNKTKKSPIKTKSLSNKCTSNKELNPKTKRCVKKCKEGFSRNEQFKCVKNKTRKSPIKPKSLSNKCTADKELNPKTKRCVKRCNLGFSRNEQFKCVKNKTAKLYSTKSSSTYSSIKPLTWGEKQQACPEGKELNPKTKRCIKRCNQGYKRNEQFKCVKDKTN